jgi:hypothetical protein
MHEYDKSSKEAECRTWIDRDAPPDDRENLLAMTQVFARMRYNNSVAKCIRDSHFGDTPRS